MNLLEINYPEDRIFLSFKWYIKGPEKWAWPMIVIPYIRKLKIIKKLIMYSKNNFKPKNTKINNTIKLKLRLSSDIIGIPKYPY
jgi:hypothetical protein